MRATSFFIHGLGLGPWKNRIYLLGNRDTGQCAVVDPAWHVETILEEAKAQDVQIDCILCTHSHLDHTQGVDALQAKTGATVHMLETEINFSKFRAKKLVAHRGRDTLGVAGEEMVWLHTPGHSPGSACLHFASQASVLTGDTLFVGGCGRCDLVGGDPQAMYDSLRTLVETLPSSTRIYPGHDYGTTETSTLGHELAHNAYLQAPNRNLFIRDRMANTAGPVALQTRLPAWSPLSERIGSA